MRILNLLNGVQSVVFGIALMLCSSVMSSSAFALEEAGASWKHSTITYSDDWNTNFFDVDDLMQAFSMAYNRQGKDSCGAGNFEIQIHRVIIVPHQQGGMTIGGGTSYTISCLS